MESSAKLNEKLDSVLEGKPAFVAPNSPTRPCPIHAGRCDCADCKLFFDRRPKYFNANVARHVECRERLKRVLKRRRAEKEEEVYSENGSSYYETEESECESEESALGNQVDDRTLDELVEFVEGTSCRKDTKKDKTEKKTPRRRLKKQMQVYEEIQKKGEPPSPIDTLEQSCVGIVHSECSVVFSDSTQPESSVETLKRSDWTVVSYPRKPCRNSANEVSKTVANNNQRSQSRKESKPQKTNSSATIISEVSLGNSLGTSAYLAGSSMCSFSNGDYSGPVLPTIVLKKSKSKNHEGYPTVNPLKRPKPPTVHNPIPSLLDLDFKVPVLPINCEVTQPIALRGVHGPSSQTSDSLVIRRPVQRDISSQLYQRMEDLHMSNKFGAIGEERKINSLAKKEVVSSGVSIIEHPLGGLMDASDEYVPAVYINHRGYRIEELQSSNHSYVEEQRGLPCKFGAIGEERKKKVMNVNPDDTLRISSRAGYVFQL